MKRRIFAALILLMLIWIWLLLHDKHEIRSAVEAVKSEASLSTSNNTPQQTQVVKQSSAAVIAEMQQRQLAREATNELGQHLLTEWRVPIEFYGKVVDESNNPVDEASVQFNWTETPEEAFEEKPGEHATTTSDANGLFELHGKHGPSLDVRVSKQGYYTSRQDTGTFSYSINGHFTPDSLNPLVFHLRKKGEGTDLITSENGIKSKVDVRAPRDNTPVWVDLFQKRPSSTGQLEIRQIKPEWKTATNWSFTLSIPDGGLVENHDEFQFKAPETSYQASVQYDFSKTVADWSQQVTKQFYISLNGKYGWLRIESNLAQETVFLTYAINPTGSRNLEPAH